MSAVVVVNMISTGAVQDGREITTHTSHATASTSSTPQTTQAVPRQPYAIADETITLVDPGGETPARGDEPAHPGRVLVTVIRRPVGLPGPLPLVVFAHGWNSNPTVYEPLLDAWAAAGYLVAAPTFPDSTDTLPGPPTSSYPDQAGDIAYVITALTSGQAGPVDPTRIAVAGHSDGGTDIALMALNPAYGDPRVRAYLSLSGEIPPNVPGPWNAAPAGSLLVAVGTDDEYGLLPKSTQVFNTARVASKVLFTVQGGDHLGTFIGSSPQSVAVRAETVRFLDTALRPGGATSDQLLTALAPADDPSIVVTAG
ncbi:MAG: hypothetical protein ABSG81_15890 [Acidimicrobiales bacterium]